MTRYAKPAALVVVRRDSTDGTLRRVLPDGSTRAMPRRWPPRPMTEAQIEAAALADPDNPPLTPGRLASMKPVSLARAGRRS